MYFARRCRTAVLPPSKRQKAQKPHSCAVFLLLKYFIFFRVQDAFLLENNSGLFFKIFSTRVPTGFFDSLRRAMLARVLLPMILSPLILVSACPVSFATTFARHKKQMRTPVKTQWDPKKSLFHKKWGPEKSLPRKKTQWGPQKSLPRKLFLGRGGAVERVRNDFSYRIKEKSF